MRNAATAGLALLSVVLLSAETSPAAEPEVKPEDIKEVVSGRNLRAIQAALPELERQVGGKVEDYYVRVQREGDFVVVLFVNPRDVAPDRPPPVGCAGP
jgi:hypothetical protein